MAGHVECVRNDQARTARGHVYFLVFRARARRDGRFAGLLRFVGLLRFAGLRAFRGAGRRFGVEARPRTRRRAPLTALRTAPVADFAAASDALPTNDRTLATPDCATPTRVSCVVLMMLFLVLFLAICFAAFVASVSEESASISVL